MNVLYKQGASYYTESQDFKLSKILFCLALSRNAVVYNF